MTPDIRQRPRTGRLPLVLRIVVAGLGMAILSLSLVACAPGSTAGAGQTPLLPQQCGSIHMTQGLGRVSDNAGQAESCFWQAYQQCQAATLSFTTMGIDAGSIRAFTITPNGSGCIVQDTIQYYVVPKGNGPSHTYTCAGLSQPEQGGLLFAACGADGNVAVPAPGA
jgi:hypothetical protein